MRLRSENLILTAQGNLSYKGALALDAQLLLNTNLQKRLRGMLPAQMAAATEVGYQQIPFKITGSGGHLQTDFWNKAGGDQIQNNIGGVLQGILNNALR